MIRKSDVVLYAEANPDSTTLLDNGKLQFTESGMEFPTTATTATLTAYANGKAYRRAKVRKANETYDFAQHLPNIVPHPDRNENFFLLCKLTSTTLPRDATKIEGHVRGRKFQRRLKEEQRKQAERERLAQARKAKQEKAKAFRQGKRSAKDSEDEKPDQKDGNSVMADEEGDVLDQVLSDSSNDSVPEEEGKESAGDDEKDEDEDMKDVEVEDTFWTRGNKPMKHSDNEDDDDSDDDSDEWTGASKSKAKKGSKTKRAKKGASKKKQLSDAKTEIKAGGSERLKRNRSEKAIPKKMRQKHQRRRVGQT